MKYTKSPWWISWNTFNDGEAHGIYADGEMDLKGHQIAVINGYPTLEDTSEDVSKANARLIAASPDLLRATDHSLYALKSAYNEILARDGNSKGWVIRCIEKSIKILEESYLKATGEPYNEITALKNNQ